MTNLKKSRMSRRDFLKVGGLAASVGLSPAALGNLERLRSINIQTPHTLTMSSISGSTLSQLQLIAEQFTAANPNVNIEFNVQADEETYKATFPQIALSSDKPDLAWYWVDGRQYLDLAKVGAFEPLDDLWAEGYADVMPDSVKSVYAVDGVYYSANLGIVWYPQVYYNVRQFEELGIALPANGVFYESLDEWNTVIQTIREAGMQPISMGGNASAAWIIGHTVDALLQRMIPENLYLNMLRNYDASVPVELAYNGPEWTAVMEQLLTWHNTGVFADGYLGRGYPEGRALFVQEEAAMYQDGNWAATAGILYAEAPDLEFGWMLYPQVNPDIPARFLTYAGNGINIPTGPSDLGLAKEFVRFAMSRETQIAFTEAELAVSARSDIPQESLDKAGFHNAQMLSALPQVGASVGWDDPIPAELAQRAHVLYGEMLTGAIAPSDVGEQLQRVLDRLRR